MHRGTASFSPNLRTRFAAHASQAVARKSRQGYRHGCKTGSPSFPLISYPEPNPWSFSHDGRPAAAVVFFLGQTRVAPGVWASLFGEYTEIPFPPRARTSRSATSAFFITESKKRAFLFS